MPTLSAGQLVAGRFEILRPLGAGGLAEVYAARDAVAGQEVALKILHAHLGRDPRLVERFQRELSLTRGLTHPGIVRVHELYRHEERPLFSMELLEGETLADKLSLGALPREEALALLRQIAQALGHAHAQGVVHRDLKPQNVFVTREGRVKLLDFGLARTLGASRVSAHAQLEGTPGYLAPELLQGRPGDARSDLYGLGAIAFELFTGRRAFQGRDPFEVLEKQRAGAPALDGPDAAAVRRALDPDPERRFVDAAQLEAALGGGAIPDAPAVPPLLQPGGYDVIGSITLAQRAEFAALGRALAGRSWSALVAPPRITLARGVSRDAAAQLTALAESFGVGAGTIAAERPVWWRRATRWVSQRPRLVFAFVLGLEVAFVLPRVLFLGAGTGLDPRAIPEGPARHPLLWALAALFGVAYAGLLAAISRGESYRLPLGGAGDPALLRLAESVRLRALRLASPAAAEVPARVAALAASDDRDAASAELLQLASALDAALQDPPSSQRRIDSALRRLSERAQEARRT